MTKPVFKVGDVWLWTTDAWGGRSEVFIIFAVRRETLGVHYASFRSELPSPIIAFYSQFFFKGFLDHDENDQVHFLGNVKDMFDLTEILPDY